MWLSKYVSSGLYEISTLAPELWKSPIHGKKELAHFIETYHKQHTELSEKPLCEIVSKLITTNQQQIYRDSGPLFIQARQTDTYRQERIKQYKQSLTEMIDRMPYRKTLDFIWKNHPNSLNAHPLLKMYALAHESRLATFFLAEERPWIFDTIKSLSEQLGLKQNLLDYCAHAHTITNTIKNA